MKRITTNETPLQLHNRLLDFHDGDCCAAGLRIAHERCVMSIKKYSDGEFLPLINYGKVEKCDAKAFLTEIVHAAGWLVAAVVCVIAIALVGA